MKILVTGATGYIGSALLKKLKGDIRILTRQDIRSSGIEVVRGDITDIVSVRKAVDGVDLVYHNAALVEHFVPYEELYKVNVIGTRNIVEAAIKEGVKKIVYTSTVAVTDKVKDDYCRSKAEAEKLVEKYWKRIEIPVVRPAPVYDSVRLEPLKKHKIPMVKLNLMLHLAYKGSVVEALVNAGKKGSSEVYTVADKSPVKLSALYETICRARGYRPFYLPAASMKIGYGLSWLAEKTAAAVGKPYPLYKVMKTMVGQDRVYDIAPAVKGLGYKPVDTLEMFGKILEKPDI
jgi:nucleoside-diphosphate-sugar epimerase